MENLSAKAYFLRNEFIDKLKQIEPATKPLWGKMNLHQMIEHMSYSLRQANGKDQYDCVTPEENIPRMQAFLMSEKPFKENTPNQLLPEDPETPKQKDIDDALAELKTETEDFFKVFEKTPDRVITNPFFGDLNYEMWVQLLHKHARHHLKQFGVNE
ncbi:DinB family protein [Polluticoccus soli]|uniref:DinB family protein n=1 Tax=Polluticoccus soli TaxID=3034150 RepID=UPI0023E0A34D|nr:DinB family protein [Flavipsychrobacter sp. JY13-12]